MPGPYRAAVGKPPAVHKRPRRGQDPSLDRPINECPHPAASSRGYPSTGGHPHRGRRPRRPRKPPVTAHLRDTPRAGHARPLPRGGGQAPCRPQTPAEGSRPSLRTAPSAGAGPYSAYVNYIRRAGCPHLPQVRAAARQRAATHVGGGVPDAPETSRRRPSPGKPPGRACPALTARGGEQAPCRPQTPAEGSDPSLRSLPINECPPLQCLRELHP